MPNPSAQDMLTLVNIDHDHCLLQSRGHHKIEMTMAKHVKKWMK